MKSDVKNLIITILLSISVLLGWQLFYENPRIEKQKLLQQSQAENEQKDDFQVDRLESVNNHSVQNIPKINIDTNTIQGEILLRGLRIDNITLKDYKEQISPDSSNVKLLFNNIKNLQYFAEFGWLSASKTKIPDRNTIWKADTNILRAGSSVKLSWDNNEGLEFIVIIHLDDNYMFEVTQKIINKSQHNLDLLPYGLIYRAMDNIEKNTVYHQGIIGVFNNLLKEITYQDILEQKKMQFEIDGGGWFGITDKYWLTSIVPDKKISYQCNVLGSQFGEVQKYQVDYVGPKVIIENGKEYEITTKFFAGPKLASLINDYSDKYEINLFDRAIDYGWFYFLTKPMFFLLSYLYKLFHNFGLAIIAMTLIIKLLMYPIAHKSYVTMMKMKKLQPKIAELKVKYGHDHIKLNTEMMEFYKKEKLSPLSGCLPIFIQIPVFFSLYKVIFISIEMRHAPFYGWVKDLSSPDPTTLFNLFGLLPWEGPAFLMLGAWPLIMMITMFIQQKISPQPVDPVQAKVMKILPFVFVLMFQSFPVGLMIYWSFSNIFSIFQQYLMSRIKYE